ncbi:hypothetical protein T1E_4328 [Pseudomonas putida DOT-T1E]|uniref:Uncharacterized protein n=1 Tax=Pseudomonas putida (strain DOT-T1E) TaxID=1196325 RepID=I7C175_PSEPT|nr:hypothetical protein T1E_4328 [Pseudomonas putida DOT-T1E]
MRLNSISHGQVDPRQGCIAHLPAAQAPPHPTPASPPPPPPNAAADAGKRRCCNATLL